MTTKAARLLTSKDVAERLNMPEPTVRTYTRRGEFADFAINLGTTQRPVWRYDPARLEKWIDTRRAA